MESFKLTFINTYFKRLKLSAEELSSRNNTMEIRIDKTIVEFFINKGKRYIIKNLSSATGKDRLVFDLDKYGPSIINHLEVYEMNSNTMD